MAVMASVLLLPLVVGPAAGAATPPDPALGWLRQHAQELVGDLQADGHFMRAADEGRPANYITPRAADLATLAHGGADVVGPDEASALVADTLSLLRQQQPAEPPEELPARAWLLAGAATASWLNSTTLCSELPPLWGQLQRNYADPAAWQGGLSFSASPRIAGIETVASSGHDTFLSLLHYRALDALAAAAERAKCGDAAPMRTAQHAISAALSDGSQPLWDDEVGMFRPSSGINANRTDVWGSALAVDTGAVTGERAARIVAWFGQHWSSVVQDGQIRHLPAIGDESGMPAGQYWPNTTTWQFGTYANGGYWGEASGWVLPVIGRANHELGQRLVRDAIAAAQRDGGLSEWQNTKFCCNCEGAAAWTGLCMTPYPSTASLRGASRYGRSVFNIYSAAKRLLGPAATAKPPRTVALPAEPEPAAPLTLHAQATAAMAAKQLAPGVDPDVAWLTEYATMYQAQARECTVRAILLERSLPLLR